jgi:D-tyrosyl-tRNA(Tyr) deacylase
MRFVCQRVLRAKVEVNNQTVGRIDKGLLVYLSVGKDDTLKDAEFIAEKLVNLRIFPDEAGKMNRSILDVGGAILLVSNFTLHGDCRKGRRPGFDAAAQPQLAEQLYEKVAGLITEHGVPVEKGVFGEYMHVTSTNDGPVTFILDSSRLF